MKNIKNDCLHANLDNRDPSVIAWHSLSSKDLSALSFQIRALGQKGD